MKRFLTWVLLITPIAVRADPIGAAIERFVESQTQGLPGRVSIVVGKTNSRTGLSTCTDHQVFLPANQKLWGKASVGVRCLGPGKWTIYVPIKVGVFGPYLRANRLLAAGQPILESDFDIMEGDLTELPAGILTDPAQAIGRPPRVGLAAGQVLRADQIVTPPAIRQGQSVRLISRGPGFSVSSEGKALNNASEGQAVQVRAASGQTVTGTARAGGVVEVFP